MRSCTSREIDADVELTWAKRHPRGPAYAHACVNPKKVDSVEPPLAIPESEMKGCLSNVLTQDSEDDMLTSESL